MVRKFFVLALFVLIGVGLLGSVAAIPTVEMGSIAGLNYATTVRTPVANVNDLVSKNFDGPLAEGFGYTRGYNDALAGKTMATFNLMETRKIVGLSPPLKESTLSQIEQIVVKHNKGRYIKAYREAYQDAQEGRERSVAEDFYIKYGVTVPTAPLPTVFDKLPNQEQLFLKYKIDPTMTVTEIATAIGTLDAQGGRGKAPLAVLNQMGVLQTLEASRLHRRLVEHKGEFLNKYNEAYLSVKPKPIAEENFGKIPQSQKPEAIKKRDANEVGAKYGRLDALSDYNAKPFHLLYSRWDLAGVSDEEIAAAKADKTAYIAAYGAAYAELSRGIVTDRVTWADRIYQMGYTLGHDDLTAGYNSRPLDHINYFKIKKRGTSEGLQMRKYLDIYREDFINGYRKGYGASV